MTTGRYKNLFQKGEQAIEFREKTTYWVFIFKLKQNEIQKLWIWCKVTAENGIKPSNLDIILFSTLSDSLAVPDWSIIVM